MATKDLGQIAINPRGNWSSSSQYVANDFVYNAFDGCGYVAKTASTNTRPDTDNTKWILCVSKGGDGASSAKSKSVHPVTDISVTGLSWDTVHVFPEMPSLTFTLASVPNDGNEHQMVIIFNTPADLTNFVLAADGNILWLGGVVLADNLSPKTRYEINIDSSSLLAVYAEATLPSQS